MRTKCIDDIEKVLTDLGINPDSKMDIISYLITKPERIQRIFYYRAIGYTWDEIAALENVARQVIKRYFDRWWGAKSDYFCIVIGGKR